MTHADRFLLAGVMGFPVIHSRSPQLHNYWLARYGLVGTYLPLAITRERLGAALRALPALGFSGCHLTIPHKQGAREIRLVNRTPARAQALELELGRPITAISWKNRERALDGAAMLVNTTSQGMVGESALDLSLDMLPASAL